MPLTAQQIEHFKTFGFVLVPGFLSRERVDALRNAVTRMKTEESGEADPLKHTGRVTGMFHKDPLLLDLFDDADLDAFAHQLLGDDLPLRFLGDEYVSYSAPADWHPDMHAHEPFESLKFGFYLDDISRGGCLRVVPGSHQQQLHSAVGSYRASAKPAPEIDGATACMTRPGDLLIFNLKLWHQGTANPQGTNRRVIFWSVGQDSDAFNTFARNFHDRNGRGTDDEPWPDALLDGRSPARTRLLDVYPAGSRKQTTLV